MKKNLALWLVTLISAIVLACGVSATSLDDLSGGAVTTSGNGTQLEGGSAPDISGIGLPSSSSIGDTYNELGVSAEDIAAAGQIISPVVKWVNIGIGIVVAILGTVLLGFTALDLLYIVSPDFIRNIGSGGAAAMPQQGGMGGMGMGMGMGGMGAQPQMQQQTTSGFASLISDDCKAALAECGAVPAAQGAQGGMGGMGMGGMGMGMGMGRYGMGGMGMGGMGAQAQPAAVKPKKVALCYLKKRVTTFIIIGICAVVLTCTCFLDVGTKLGQWIVDMVNGAV